MRFKYFQQITVLFIGLTFGLESMAYEAEYNKTPVDEIRVLTLPDARLITTGTEGDYFDNSNNMFKRLFKYIRDNDISMTVPVEGKLGQAEMRFYLGNDASPTLDSTSEVHIIELPERMVISMGGKGSYNEKNINRVRAELEASLKTNQDLMPAGDPYVVFWNGPFTPWLFKRFDVHIPVKQVSQ